MGTAFCAIMSHERLESPSAFFNVSGLNVVIDNFELQSAVSPAVCNLKLADLPKLVGIYLNSRMKETAIPLLNVVAQNQGTLFVIIPGVSSRQIQHAVEQTVINWLQRNGVRGIQVIAASARADAYHGMVSEPSQSAMEF